MPQNNLLEKRLAEEPIILPASPLWEVLRVFGRDQLIALVINVIGTAVIAGFVRNSIVLAIAGPAVEKIGFFIAYFKEAWSIYTTTPKAKRLSIYQYIHNAFKKGLASLSKDLAAHDPIYALLMYLGLNIYPDTPAWILSTSSFIGALGVVAIGEVLINELRYYIQIFKYKRAGFKLESYFESRFYIKNSEPNKVLMDLSDKFELMVKSSTKYHDRYFETNLKNYNGRKPALRLRQRTKEEGDYNQTVQIIYTRASEISRDRPGQFNYYPTKKDKAWIQLSQNMPWAIEDIADKKLRKICKSIITDTRQDVFFSREVARNPKNILVSVDQINAGNSSPIIIVEIKSRSDDKSKKILIEAMRYVMLRYEVIQTTYDKEMLTSLESI